MLDLWVDRQKDSLCCAGIYSAVGEARNIQKVPDWDKDSKTGLGVGVGHSVWSCLPRTLQKQQSAFTYHCSSGILGREGTGTKSEAHGDTQ